MFKSVLKILGQRGLVNLARVASLRWAGYKISWSVFIGKDLIIVDEIDEAQQISIKDRVAIAPRVTLITSSYPNNSRFRESAPTAHRPIVIECDAWRGRRHYLAWNNCR